MKTGGIARNKRSPKRAHLVISKSRVQIVADRDLKLRSGRYGGCQSGSYGWFAYAGRKHLSYAWAGVWDCDWIQAAHISIESPPLAKLKFCCCCCWPPAPKPK